MQIKLEAKSVVDCLVVGCFQGEEKKLSTYLKGRNFEARYGEILVCANDKQTVCLLGLGKKNNYGLNCIRKAAAKALSFAKTQKFKSIRLDVDSFTADMGTAAVVEAMTEGLRMSNYSFQKYKSKPASASSVTVVYLGAQNISKTLQKALLDAEIVCEGIYFTRNVANEPANVINPETLAKAAQEMARKNNLICKVLTLSELKKLGMGGIIGVCQGSSYEPRLVVLENKVTSKEKPIVFVGKGVTFDTGGISIKPSNDMDKMKFDMSGAAAVMGAMLAIAKLKVPVKCVGITPLVENMPGSKAIRPGDILRFMNGKTAEVLNTDAEGRLILADALCYAKRYQPKALVDIATLTGACSVTFADICSGLMTTDSQLGDKLKKIGEKTGEKLWELPLWDEYFDLIRATYADIQNISKKYAGTITAGMFLKEFADHTKSWAHLDVAGTAWADNAKPLSPVGNTGIGVRWFVELAKSYA